MNTGTRYEEPLRRAFYLEFHDLFCLRLCYKELEVGVMYLGGVFRRFVCWFQSSPCKYLRERLMVTRSKDSLFFFARGRV